MWSITKKFNNQSSINSTSLLVYDASTISFFKRSFSFEQKIMTSIYSNNIKTLNRTTYDLIFDVSQITERKGYLTNFSDKQIQSLPKNMYSFKKALNPYTFFNDNPHLNVVVNPNDYTTIQQLNQRTNGICEVLAAEAIKRENMNHQVWLTHGNISNKLLAYKHTHQMNCDYYCARVLYNGQIYNYYADLKLTDKNTFLSKISSLHPNQLMLCQVYIVGGIDDSFIFNSHVKTQLITGCQHYMLRHIIDNTPISQYNNQLIRDLGVFDNNPTLSNYNSLVVAPWRIFSVPSITKIFNA